MCCTSEDVKRSVEGFKKDIGDKKTKYLDSVKSEDAIKYAFDNAYGDAKRTLTGIRDFQKEKETAKGRIVEKMLDYFNGPAPSGQEAFDVLHEEMCMLWCTQFTESRKDLGTYGKAQKSSTCRSNISFAAKMRRSTMPTSNTAICRWTLLLSSGLSVLLRMKKRMHCV